MNASSPSSPSSVASSSAAIPAGHDVSTASIVFVPPPLPAFLATPCRPGYQPSAVRHPPITPCTQLPPRPKLRRCAWSKIPASRVLGRSNVWTTGDRLFREFQLDFERIEELFSVAASTSTQSTAPLSPSSTTGVKYPSSVSAAGLQESSSRQSAVSTSKPRVQSSEVSCIIFSVCDSVYRFSSDDEYFSFTAVAAWAATISLRRHTKCCRN